MKRTCLKEKLLKHTQTKSIIHELQESKVIMSQNECAQGHVSWLSVCWEGSLYSQAVLNMLKTSKEILSGDVSEGDASHITLPWPCFFSWQSFILSFHSILTEHLLHVKHSSRYWGIRTQPWTSQILWLIETDMKQYPYSQSNLIATCDKC